MSGPAQRPSPPAPAVARPSPPTFGGPAPSAVVPSSPLRALQVVRYVTPLREGGSLPALIEADDDGLYVLKFRGAGQGVPALLAECVAGELARAFGLRVPELVTLELDPELARTEPDPEVQDLIRASAGLNLGMDFLPGAVTFDVLAHPVGADEASDLVVFDAFTMNVDRTARNTNLLVWHRHLWLIDHGAALIVHHDWPSAAGKAGSVFAPIRDHVLLARATHTAAARERLLARLTDDVIDAVLARVPDAWLGPAHSPFADVAAHRAAYRCFLRERRQASARFVEEIDRARDALV